MAGFPVSTVSISNSVVLKILGHLPVKLIKEDTSSFRILPIRSTSVTSPAEMNVAHTLIATEASSGDESAPNAGVNAELICA